MGGVEPRHSRSKIPIQLVFVLFELRLDFFFDPTRVAIQFGFQRVYEIRDSNWEGAQRRLFDGFPLRTPYDMSWFGRRWSIGRRTSGRVVALLLDRSTRRNSGCACPRTPTRSTSSRLHRLL